MIVIVDTYPPCGLDTSLQVENKRQSTSTALVGNTQKLDAVVDINLLNDMDYASIFGELIGHKLSGSSSNDLNLRCRIKFVGQVVQTQTPQFMDMGILTINSLDESSVLGTPANSI